MKINILLPVATALLISCVYNGISGSSAGDDTSAIEGLWIQAEGTAITGEVGDNHCGCRQEGRSNGGLRRCFNYFENGKIVSGYLKIGGSYNNCNLEYTISESSKNQLFELINQNKNRDSGSSIININADGAVGTFRHRGSNRRVGAKDTNTIGESLGGVYFDIAYDTPILNRLDIVCSSYWIIGNDLYIAASQSGGVLPNELLIECDSERHIDNLIRYTKVE